MSSQLFPSAARRVLVTGGAGYIGSITVVRLIEAGWTPLILDNFSNSHPEVLQRIERLTGYAPQLYRADVRDRAALDRVFAEQRIDAVIHFAGLKAVGESVRLPLDYAEVNVAGSVQLLQAMRQHGVRHIVFSSSATVYGEARVMPLTENMSGVPTSPYGRSKWQVEQILADLAASDAGWSVAALRYFNPVGAHPSGELGEDPQGTPNNLMPFIAQVAVGRQPELRVFGSDYPTVDGTGVRDYLHVLDLADGHVAALELLRREAGLHVLNLGTGRGHSVLELKTAFERACGRELPTRIVERRPGDVAQMWADASRARDKLGWQAQLSLQQMCDDTWRWQSRYPQGYRAR